MKGPPPHDEPIGLLAAAVRSRIRQLLASRLEPLGLSVQQFWLLVGIAEARCECQAALAARMRMDEATTCRVVRALASRELVRAERDASDRRRVRLELTPGGERLVVDLLPVARQVRAIVDSALSPEERTATRAALRKILSVLEGGVALQASPTPRERPARPRRSPELSRS